jgi:hypothetical protein
MLLLLHNHPLPVSFLSNRVFSECRPLSAGTGVRR